MQRYVLPFRCKGEQRKVVMEWNKKRDAVAVRFYHHATERIWWMRCVIIVKNKKEATYRDRYGREVTVKCSDMDSFYFPTAVSYIVRRGLKGADVLSDGCIYDIRDLLWLAETNEWVLKKISQLIEGV